VICLDTNVIIAAINRRPSQIRERLEQALVGGQEVAIPAIVLFEMWYGIAKSRSVEESAANLARFLTLDVVVVSFDDEDAREAGDIRAALAKVGTPIGPYDVLIAAQARRRDAMLVTANGREFSLVPGLKTENWAAPI
jgi:tRNA(fMet)-specific endonuclease VapC